MTRKDYKLIAEAIRNALPLTGGFELPSDRSRRAALLDLADYLSVSLKEDNPRFDRAKFFKACGL